jgi:hypothetical protein
MLRRIRKKIIYNKDVSPKGTVDHVDIGDATHIDCSGCSNLKRLPEWENVVSVDCSHCPRLTQLPCWEKVKFVCCYNCFDLTQLPDWEKVTRVYYNSIT